MIGRVLRVFRCGVAMLEFGDGDVRVVRFPRGPRPAPGERGRVRLEHRDVVAWRRVETNG
jgi:hypothetical protein